MWWPMAGGQRVEHIIGGHVSRDRFDRFLADWERVLDHRVEQALGAIGVIDGVHGLVLAGSIGRGDRWPLSDIDLIPIIDGDLAEQVHNEIERRRLALINQWLPEGWWTGVDIGRLYFTRQELAETLPVAPESMPSLLADERWYHNFDKGYGGRPVIDPSGLGAELVRTFNSYRFARPTVEIRMRRAAQSATSAFQNLSLAISREDPLAATIAIHDAVKWIRARQLEIWGESDSSLGRVGTRFERLARSRGQHDLVLKLRDISDLDDVSVRRRLERASGWVLERHDRSWSARKTIGEELTELDDARDVLRVCAQYELRSLGGEPYPAWLEVPDEAGSLRARVSMLDALVFAS